MTSLIAKNNEVCTHLQGNKDGRSGRCRKCHAFGKEHRAAGQLLDAIDDGHSPATSNSSVLAAAVAAHGLKVQTSEPES